MAEAELEYDNNYISPSVYVRFTLKNLPRSIEVGEDKKLFALIWTTTPWTLASNQAICFNSTLKYSIVEINHNGNTDLYLLASNLVEDIVKDTNLNCVIKQTIPGTIRIIINLRALTLPCHYFRKIFGKLYVSASY